MWINKPDDEHLLEPFKPSTAPADLRVAQSMERIAQHYVDELDAQFRTVRSAASSSGRIFPTRATLPKVSALRRIPLSDARALRHSGAP